MTDYKYIPAVRRSELWEIRKSPAHYQYMITHNQEETPALIFGRAAHKFVLEPETFADEYVIAPQVDRRTKAGKEEWAAFLAESEGMTPISEQDMVVIREMNAAIESHPVAKALLKTGQHEVGFEWTDGITDEPCKCRPDTLTEWNGEKYIVDYKTTNSCEDGAFERACKYYGYKLQAAMYTEGVFCNTFETRKFAFVAQEKAPPYAVRVYFCDPGFVDDGMATFRELIGIYHKCRASGEWPGYRDGVLYGE